MTLIFSLEFITLDIGNKTDLQETIDKVFINKMHDNNKRKLFIGCSTL